MSKKSHLSNNTFYSISRGTLNIDGQFFYGIHYQITDFIRSLDNELKEKEKIIDKIDHIINNQFNYYEYVDIINDIEDVLKGSDNSE